MDIRFRTKGCGRFGIAGFLFVWLAGWSVGEYFALRLLYWGVGRALHGEIGPPGSGVTGCFMALFLLIWIVGWTFAGVAALIEFLRLLAGEDRLIVGPDNVTIRRGVGALGRSRTFSRHSVREIYVNRRSTELVLETSDSRYTITRFGSIEERRDAAARADIRPPEEDHRLPTGWLASPQPDGTTLIARNQLAIVKRDWFVGRDIVRRRTRFLAWNWTESADPQSLRVDVHRDSDGDDWHSLRVNAGGKPRTILHVMNEDRDVTRLAGWFGRLTGWNVPDREG